MRSGVENHGQGHCFLKLLLDHDGTHFDSNADALGYNPEHIDNLIQQTAARMLPVYTKIRSAPKNSPHPPRLSIIPQTDHLTLEEELYHPPTIPKCYQLILALTQKLPACKARADAQVFPSLISQSLIHMHLCSTTTYPSLPSELCLKRFARSCGPSGGRHLSNYPTDRSGRRKWHSSRLRPAPLSVFFAVIARHGRQPTEGARELHVRRRPCALTVYGWTKITFSYLVCGLQCDRVMEAITNDQSSYNTSVENVYSLFLQSVFRYFRCTERTVVQ